MTRASRRAALGAALALTAPAALAQGTPRAAVPLPSERPFGQPDAAVTVVEYHSLTCGACANFHANVLPQVTRAFVEPGLVRIVYRDYPLDRIALDAAALAHCGGPERHKAMLDLLYLNQQAWSRGADPRAALRRFGAVAGLGADQIESYWTDNAVLAAILEMRQRGERDHGVNATPSFLIGGQLHKGVLEFGRFSELVRPLLPPGALARGG